MDMSDIEKVNAFIKCHYSWFIRGKEVKAY